MDEDTQSPCIHCVALAELRVGFCEGAVGTREEQAQGLGLALALPAARQVLM